MDFSRHETGTPQSSRPVGQSGAANLGVTATQHKLSNKKIGTWTRVGYASLLFAVTILVVAIASLIGFTSYSQSKYIDSSKFQAVFINDGSSSGQSVYFGHITRLTNSYLVLQDVYYITTSSSTNPSSATSASNSNYTLTKLGCQQLHDPYDEMVVNTSQIAFWENLQDNGKVVSAINSFQKANPNGPNCSQSSSTVSSSSTTQNTASTQASH